MLNIIVQILVVLAVEHERKNLSSSIVLTDNITISINKLRKRKYDDLK